MNVNKILQLKSYQIGSVLEKIQSKRDIISILTGISSHLLDEGELNLEKHHLVSNIKQQINLLTRNIYLSGKYIKFSRFFYHIFRYLSQTPWIV
jgi:hypothetical protein